MDTEVTGIWAGEGPGFIADSLNHSTGRNTHADTQIRQKQRPTPSIKMHTDVQRHSIHNLETPSIYSLTDTHVHMERYTSVDTQMYPERQFCSDTHLHICRDFLSNCHT